MSRSLLALSVYESQGSIPSLTVFWHLIHKFRIYSHYILQKKIDMQPKPLFNKGKSTNIGKLLGEWKVLKKEQPMQIQLYDNALLQINLSDSSSSTMDFDFDLKYSFTKEPLEIKFQRGSQLCTYKLASEQELQSWRDILKKKLNQRGFHEQFKPIKKIGKGNFAAVYLAQKLEDKINYAVKAFSKESAYSEQNGKECLIKEIEVMRNLNHKNIMKLHEVFESQNSLYIIFQLLSGGQLYDKVKSKYKFRAEQTQKIIHSILLGLEAMHEKGIMHRDLKPQNLLFRNGCDCQCVIADFGLAEFADIDSYLFVRCGTPGYVAPEVINIKDLKVKYSPICDMYSLGLIFHILLLGKSAFPGTTYNEVLSQNRAAVIDFSSDQYKKISPNALDLLSHLLKKKPNERINATNALHHPYFKGVKFEEPKKIIEEPIDKTVSDNLQISTNGYPNCESPLLTTANKKRKLDKSMKKDSCVEFHMGKQNIVTGKTEDVDSMKNNKVSINNPGTPIKKPKVSQFCAQRK